MKVVVLGGGTVGASIADLLCQRRHSVTVVDSDSQRCKHLDEQLDVRVLVGSASQSSVLFQAGVMDADLCLTVTGDDEVNIVGASLAKAMGARRALARVYAAVLRDLSTFDYQRHFHVDRLLSVEHLSAVALARGIGRSGSMIIEHLARGGVEVQELVVERQSSAVGVPLRSLRLPAGVRIGSILRDGRLWIAGADDTLEMADRVTLIGTQENIAEVEEWFQATPAVQTVVIAGGGETGYHLAQALAGPAYHVVIMDSDPQRCEHLAERLPRATVVNSDCTRRVDMEEERVGAADVFVGCTGEDEDNIMAGVEARELGAKRILAVVTRPDYANVVSKLGIDVAVSPRDVMARQVLSYLQTGPVISRSPLLGGGVDILELNVLEGAPVTRGPLHELSLPQQCLIAARIREGFVTVPGADDELAAGDTVVALIDYHSVDTALRFFDANGQAS